MSEKQRLAFSGTIIAKIGDAHMEYVSHSESSVCFLSDVATVEPHHGGVTVSVANPVNPTAVEAKILLDCKTAKHLAHALNAVAFAVDPEPFAIGISGGEASSYSSVRGECSALEFYEAKWKRETQGKQAWKADVIEWLEARVGDVPPEDREQIAAEFAEVARKLDHAPVGN
jgi:hypothetical protein